MKCFCVTAALLVIFSSVNSQYTIPQGLNIECYSTGDCTGDVDEGLTEMFDQPTNINHCCYDTSFITTQRSDPNNLSFKINEGGCRTCADESVVNSENVHCYTNCDTSSPSNNVLQDFIDMSIGNLNVCCSNGGVTTGYGTDTSSCTLCYDLGSDGSVGLDPHFYLPLANGNHMCFSVQGEPNFVFNLISDKYLQLNALFVLPAEDESNTIANVSTFLGDLGMVIRNKDKGRPIFIHVSAHDHSVILDNGITVVKDKPVIVNVHNSTVTINIDATDQTTKLVKDESAWLHINTEGFSIKVRFYKRHLDIFLANTSGLSKHTHGLIGQFLTTDVNIDTKNMLMKLGDRDPISVKKDKVWPHLGINSECWYGVDTNNQGAGIIEGIYTDYIVDHLIPKEN